MKITEAALTALYPVMALMAAIIWLRFLPVIKHLDDGKRALVCATLALVATIFYEQVLYGWGRLSGEYMTLATNPLVVGAGKIGYILGMSYMLYAFWLIGPGKPNLTAPLAWAGAMWFAVFLALLF